MTPWHALQMALRAEQRAFAFFDHVARTAPRSRMKAWAEEFREEEAEHVELVERLLEKYPNPEHGWDEDDDAAGLAGLNNGGRDGAMTVLQPTNGRCRSVMPTASPAMPAGSCSLPVRSAGAPQQEFESEDLAPQFEQALRMFSTCWPRPAAARRHLPHDGLLHRQARLSCRPAGLGASGASIWAAISRHEHDLRLRPARQSRHGRTRSDRRSSMTGRACT